ncbi:DUF169 domain-containing protein [Anaeromyxobacter oryzae]|uniref:DUF169 domain-containing protein n=1 Tax=Anaeromyxobacter oryzae TaxID=2918170 RepID=A0ABM7WNX9_9BACT|nr:DUF169 domain-containing protein [Anaeromyxobacter oryzae]BDG01164.1 hypothetical protein AMOR_01600 [Anaeromyxobacter oryzae]
MDASTLNAQLEKHLRVSTFPVGIRSLAPGEPAPPKAKRPLQHLGVKVAICQGIGFARRYGWTLAMGGEDLSCPIAKAVFGFAPRNEYYTSGALADGMYASCREAGARFEEALAKYEPGETGLVVAGPLGRIDFVPQTVLVYGNSAQVLRLLNACLFEKGGAIGGEFSGRGDCSDIVIRSHRQQKPQVILPCYGDRIFGMTADDEMAFTFPFAMAEQVVKGLEGTHAGGVRYPIPVYLRYQAEFPKSYQELEKLWADPEAKDRG